MNKPYNQTDKERDQSRRLEQEQADRQKSREQDSDRRRQGQEQAEHEPSRQQAGWNTGEDRRDDPAKPTGRDNDSGEQIIDEP